MGARRARCDRAVGPNEQAQFVARHTVPDAHGGDLDDLRGANVPIRRLEVDRREIAELVPKAAHSEELSGLEEGEGKTENRRLIG